MLGLIHFHLFFFCFLFRLWILIQAPHSASPWRGGMRVRQKGSKGFGTDKLHKWTNLPLFFPFALLCFPQTTKAFLPKMLELNHGHIVTVASSLGLFSTAGVEVSIIHNNAYTSHRSHHPKPVLFSKALSVPARILGQGRWGPLSLVVPPPVKLRDADEHWGALIDSSICSSGGVRPLLGSGPGARMSWQLPKGQRHLHHCFVSNLVLTQYSAHSSFQWIRFWFSFL